MSVLLVGVFVALSLFYYFAQRRKIRRAQQRDRLKGKHADLLDNFT